MKSNSLVSINNSINAKWSKSVGNVIEALKVLSSMAAVFIVLAVTGPLAYGIQTLDFWY